MLLSAKTIIACSQAGNGFIAFFSTLPCPEGRHPDAAHRLPWTVALDCAPVYQAERTHVVLCGLTDEKRAIIPASESVANRN